MALAINDLLKGVGKERFGIIVPWVYGKEQKQIMSEGFKDVIDKHPDEILLDKTLGSLLRQIFYDKNGYENSLRFYLNNYKRVETEISDYFSKGLSAETFKGKKIKINKREIALSISRAPRVSFPIKPAYHVGFAYISEILERAIEVKEIAADKNLFKKIIPIYKKTERQHDLHFIAEPSTFLHLPNRPKRYSNEISTPPNIAIKPDFFSHSPTKEKKIYVTVTGIPGLGRLFEEAKKLDIDIYTNQPELIKNSKKASPDIINGCLLHFARSGWGSVWLSMFKGVPFIAPAYDNHDKKRYDDPEIYFNNICLEKIGLGKIYKNESLPELLKFKNDYLTAVKKMNQYLTDKYGTLDGVKYTAEKIIKHFLVERNK